MGCFDSTCALTRLPIHVGDRIVYVEYRPDYTTDRISTYDFLSTVYQCAEYKNIESSITSARITAKMVQRVLNQNPDFDFDKEVEELLEQGSKLYKEKIVIVHGEYNDYGGIGNQHAGETVYPPDNIRRSSLYFFVHEDAWDIFAFGDELIISETDDYKTLYNLVRNAFNARVELFSYDNPLGQQYSEGEFLEARKKIRDVEESILPRLWCSRSMLEDYDE